MCSTSGWSAPRWSISRSASCGLDGGIDGHRVAQPEGVHGDEDRAPRCAAGRRRVGAARRPRPRGRGRVARRLRAATCATEDIWDRFVDRVLSFVDVEALRPLRIVIDAANGMAGAMLPPVLDRLPMLDVVRCYFEPDGSFPNHEPNPLLPGEPRVHHRQDARGGRRLRRRLRRRRRPMLLRRRHGRVRAGRLHDRAVRRDDPRHASPAAR